MNRTVTLSDADGNPLGQADLLKAHTGEGSCHLAFSAYVFNPERTALLIQQRSREKMLWPLIWANTCCSHPFENEEATVAGERRLTEELGVKTSLTKGPSFVYRALDPAGKGVEHEFVTILQGILDEKTPMHPNPKEVADWKWANIPELRTAMKVNPDQYAPWFHLGLEKLLSS